MGDGLALFRAVDTYHMIFIAHYTPLTWEICNKRQLPELKDKNDLSSREEARADTILEVDELSKEDVHEFSGAQPCAMAGITAPSNKICGVT
jgi:hypothetical protein